MPLVAFHIFFHHNTMLVSKIYKKTDFQLFKNKLKFHSKNH